MATILNNAPYMGFPLSIKRGNPAPVDTTAVWYNKTELETYAASGATAYVGQILTLVADSKCEAYMISNEAGTLIKLASTTASGDLASDVATLQGQVADLIAAVGKKAAGEEPATGIYKDIADVITLANSKVASVKAADKSITVAGTATAPTVKVALSAAEGNALELATDGLKVTIPEVTVPAYSMKKLDSATAGMSASYQLTKDGAGIGAIIDIPKDMVVESGTVETYTAEHLPTGVTEPGTYIVLTLANATSDKLYIPASGLIEYVTGGSGENDAIQINVTADTHKVTATVKEGSLTKAMLSTEVQGLLDKAGTAVQTIETGSANGTISVDDKDVKVKGLADAAYATVASLNTTAKGYADGIKTAIIGDADTDTADSQTLEGVKKYAHGQAIAAQEGATKAAEKLVNDLDVTDTAVATQLVSEVSQTDGKITVTRRALVAADIPELAQSKISGLETALEGKQDNIAFDGTYNASTNKAATISTVSAIVTNGADKATDNTIKGAKLYADSKASEAETAAKAYADGLVTGDAGIAKRVETLEGKVDVDKVSTAISTADNAVKTALIGTTTDTADKDTINGAKKYTDNKIKPISDSVNDLQAAVSQNSAAITKLNGADTVEGSVDYKIKTTKDALIAEINGKQDRFATVTATENDQTLNFDEGSLSIFTTKNQAYDEIKSGKVLQLTATQEIFLYGQVGLAANKTFDASYSDIKVKTTPTGDTSAVNKSYVDSAITTATAGLSGAMHYCGASETDPTSEDGPTGVTGSGKSGAFVKGDVVTYGIKEYVYDGTSWRELGTEGSYAVKGAIKDADIATDAAIAQSKIANLDVALAAKLNSTDAESLYVAKKTGFSLVDDAEITKLGTVEVHAQANKIESIKAGGTALTIATDKSVNIPAATASAFGVVKVDNTSIKSTNGTIAIKAVSTDLLTQGTETLILNCGGAAD